MSKQVSSSVASRTGPTVARKRVASRTEELVQTSFRLPLSRWKKLQQLSIEERTSVQSILVSALELEFARRGLSF